MYLILVVLSVILGVAAATGPVIYGFYHSMRHGHHAGRPEPTNKPALADPQHFGWTVCAECKAVILDPLEHLLAVHARSAA